MSKKLRFFAILAGVLIAGSSYAEEPVAMTAPAGSPAATEPAQAPEQQEVSVGQSTLGLLELQRSGAAGRAPLPMLGDEASLAYARYLESFSHKIPEFFNSTVTSGGENASSGSSN